MPLGIALILIFVLYLIDKHGRWWQAVKITAAFIVIAAIGVGGLLVWQEYEAWITARQGARRDAEEARQVAQQQAEVAKTCKDWEEKHPVGSPLDKMKDAVLDDGSKVSEITVNPPLGCAGPLETAYANAEAVDAEAKRCDPKANPFAKIGGTITGCPPLQRAAQIAPHNKNKGDESWKNLATRSPIIPPSPPDHETLNSVYVT